MAQNFRTDPSDGSSRYPRGRSTSGPDHSSELGWLYSLKHFPDSTSYAPKRDSSSSVAPDERIESRHGKSGGIWWELEPSSESSDAEPSPRSPSLYTRKLDYQESPPHSSPMTRGDSSGTSIGEFPLPALIPNVQAPRPLRVIRRKTSRRLMGGKPQTHVMMGTSHATSRARRVLSRSKAFAALGITDSSDYDPSYSLSPGIHPQNMEGDRLDWSDRDFTSDITMSPNDWVNRWNELDQDDRDENCQESSGSQNEDLSLPTETRDHEPPRPASSCYNRSRPYSPHLFTTQHQPNMHHFHPRNPGPGSSTGSSRKSEGPEGILNIVQHALRPSSWRRSSTSSSSAALRPASAAGVSSISSGTSSMLSGQMQARERRASSAAGSGWKPSLLTFSQHENRPESSLTQVMSPIPSLCGGHLGPSNSSSGSWDPPPLIADDSSSEYETSDRLPSDQGVKTPSSKILADINTELSLRPYQDYYSQGNDSRTKNPPGSPSSGTSSNMVGGITYPSSNRLGVGDMPQTLLSPISGHSREMDGRARATSVGQSGSRAGADSIFSSNYLTSDRRVQTQREHSSSISRGGGVGPSPHKRLSGVQSRTNESSNEASFPIGRGRGRRVSVENRGGAEARDLVHHGVVGTSTNSSNDRRTRCLSHGPPGVTNWLGPEDECLIGLTEKISHGGDQSHAQQARASSRSKYQPRTKSKEGPSIMSLLGILHHRQPSPERNHYGGGAARGLESPDSAGSSASSKRRQALKRSIRVIGTVEPSDLDVMGGGPGGGEVGVGAVAGSGGGVSWPGSGFKTGGVGVPLNRFEGAKGNTGSDADRDERIGSWSGPRSRWRSSSARGKALASGGSAQPVLGRNSAAVVRPVESTSGVLAVPYSSLSQVEAPPEMDVVAADQTHSIGGGRIRASIDGRGKDYGAAKRPSTGVGGGLQLHPRQDADELLKAKEILERAGMTVVGWDRVNSNRGDGGMI